MPLTCFWQASAQQQNSDEGFSPWKVILVSSSRHPDQWIVPGGGMEPEEEPCGAAVREVYEEVSPVFQINKWTKTFPHWIWLTFCCGCCFKWPGEVVQFELNSCEMLLIPFKVSALLPYACSLHKLTLIQLILSHLQIAYFLMTRPCHQNAFNACIVNVTDFII